MKKILMGILIAVSILLAGIAGGILFAKLVMASADRMVERQLALEQKVRYKYADLLTSLHKADRKVIASDIQFNNLKEIEASNPGSLSKEGQVDLEANEIDRQEAGSEFNSLADEYNRGILEYPWRSSNAFMHARENWYHTKTLPAFVRPYDK